jgi:hypothetical protein
VDTESDLNVYVDMARDTESQRREATGCCEKIESCCAKNDAAGASFLDGEDDTKTDGSASCCSTNGLALKHTEGGEKAIMSSNISLSDIDINEWAGKCLHLLQLFLS